MIYTQWQPGTAISPPVYLDANILVGATVSGHHLYPDCTQLLADLMARQCPILLSTVSLSEHLWAISSLSYFELAKQNPGKKPHFSKKIYLSWYARLFQNYNARFTVLGSLVKNLLGGGYPLEIVPGTMSDCDQTLDRTIAHMQQLGLTPNDAMHLALAEIHAHTFVTADSDYRKVASYSPAVNLVVLHI